MIKRSLLVLTLLAAGIVLGVLATGALKVRDSIATVEAAPPPPPKAEPVSVTTPVPELQAPPPNPEPRQDPPAANGGPKIGVVNIRMCLDDQHYDFSKEVTAEIKKLDEEQQRALKDLESQIITIREQMKGIPQDSALWREKARKKKLLEMQLELDLKIARARFLADYSEKKLKVYNEIRRVIDIYGKDKKFDFILRVEEPQLDDDMPQYVSQQIAARVVLYHAPAYDITTDLLKLLNSEYAKIKAAAPRVENLCPTCNIKTFDVKCPKCQKEIPKK